MIHGSPDVGAGVDAGHDQIERTAERTEPSEEDAQGRRAADLPDRVGRTVGDLGASYLGLDEVERAEGSTGARVLLIRCGHHDLVAAIEFADRSGQHVQADRVDAVVVRHQDSHPAILAAPGRFQLNAR